MHKMQKIQEMQEKQTKRKIQRKLQQEWLKEGLKAVEVAEAQEISRANRRRLESLLKKESLNLTLDETNYKLDRADIEYIAAKKQQEFIIIQNGKQTKYEDFDFNKQAIILVEDILNLFEQGFYIVYEYFPK